MTNNNSPRHFSFLLPAGKEWFTPKEAAAVIGRTDQFIRDALENHRIQGHTTNARGQNKRRTYQIHRDGLLQYLLDTANYEPVEKVEWLGEILKRSNSDERKFYRSCLGEF